MPLSLAKNDKEVRLIGIQCGRRMRRRLAELGLTVGVRLQVLHNAGKGPVILGVRDCRLALGQRVAQRLLVAPING